MTTPTSATRVPTPPITRHCSILYRGGAQPLSIPGWPAPQFLFLNQWHRDRGRGGAGSLTYNRDMAEVEHKLWINPLDKHPLVILDAENDHDVWDEKHFAIMEAERASINTVFPHVRVCAYVGNMYQLLTSRESAAKKSKRLAFLRAFAAPFCTPNNAGISVPAYVSHGDTFSLPRKTVEGWAKIIPKDKIVVTCWHRVKANAKNPARNCSPKEWDRQLAACVPGVREVVWWADADNGQLGFGTDSDPRTLRAFVAQLGAAP